MLTALKQQQEKNTGSVENLDQGSCWTINLLFTPTTTALEYRPVEAVETKIVFSLISIIARVCQKFANVFTKV